MNKQGTEPCQCYYRDLRSATLPDARSILPLRRWWWRLKKYVWFISVWGPFEFASRMLRFKFLKKSVSPISTGDGLDLQPRELVEVRSEKEIFATLNHEGKLRGLSFVPEMRKYCGKQFRVYKKLKKIIIETTGELRTVRTPTVFLEGVICDGKAHGGCDRSCFIFWRESWLKRVPQSLHKEKASI